ncbi:MAG: hypothetical protein PHQ91_00180 [Thermoanaerobaculaceae bacterium]|nr:hypothetical protein [Thermoanaerobaculaceae bacterium]
MEEDRYGTDAIIKAMRTGRHFGGGRAVLPPMPWTWVGTMTDEDLEAIVACLQSIPPIRNRVPVPVPPAPAGGAT